MKDPYEPELVETAGGYDFYITARVWTTFSNERCAVYQAVPAGSPPPRSTHGYYDLTALKKMKGVR